MLSLCWRTSLGILISMFSITYHLVQNSCSYPVNGAVHFISPYVPARGGTAGKQLHTGHVSHQGLNAAAGLLRFFAVFLNAGMNHLMDISFVPLGVASGRQQAQFRVGSRPVSWSPKYCVSSPVQLDPDKSCGFEGKAPGFHDTPRFTEHRHSDPEEQGAVVCGQLRDPCFNCGECWLLGALAAMLLNLVGLVHLLID